jgi:hypothetical protein
VAADSAMKVSSVFLCFMVEPFKMMDVRIENQFVSG